MELQTSHKDDTTKMMKIQTSKADDKNEVHSFVSCEEKRCQSSVFFRGAAGISVLNCRKLLHGSPHDFGSPLSSFLFSWFAPGLPLGCPVIVSQVCL